MAGFRKETIDVRLKYGIAWTKATRKPLNDDAKEDFIAWLMKSYKMTEAVAEGVYDAYDWAYGINEDIMSAERFMRKLEHRRKKEEEFNKRFSKIEEQLSKLTDETERKVKAETRK